MQEYRRDQIAAENEKDVDPDPTADREHKPHHMVPNHQDDRESAEAVERGIVAQSEILLTGDGMAYEGSE